MRGSRSTELARLMKEEESKKKNIWLVLQVFALVLSRCLLAPLKVLLVMKTLENEWYIAIEAYKLAVFEILRSLHVHIESTDSMIHMFADCITFLFSN